MAQEWMLVRVVKEFDLKSNGVSLVGSNPAVSDYFLRARVHSSRNMLHSYFIM